MDNRDRKNIIYQEHSTKVDQNGIVIDKQHRKLIKVPRTPDFIMLFTKQVAFLENLAKGETAVLSEILSKYVGVENLIFLSPAIKATITKKLNVDKSYVNKAIRGLIEKKVISENAEKMTYLNPHLFGKGNWEDIHKLRHEITFDFKKNEIEKKVTTQHDNNLENTPHEVIDTKEYKDDDGTVHQEITIQESENKDHPNQTVIAFDDKAQETNDDDLDMLKEQNKSRELAIQEMRLKLEMKKEGLL